MDEIRNPFAPGAGNAPPELAGRAEILRQATIALLRIRAGRHHRSQILMGLRGVGKTVLLVEIHRQAQRKGFESCLIEAPDGGRLGVLLIPEIRRILQRLSTVEAAKDRAYRAMRVLRSFVSSYQITYEDVTFSVDPMPGEAQSGDLAVDLQDLLLAVGQAAASAERGAALLIDELQYLPVEDFKALIVSLHRISQMGLPVVVFGAGLPQIRGQAGDAKSYAERLFDYVEIGALPADAARSALEEPVSREGASIDDEALDTIITRTEGYPYFLQEWGYQAWNAASDQTITCADAHTADNRALERLDQGFFRVRFDRLTPAEQSYMRGMAELGPGPHRSGDIADALGRPVQSVGPVRSNLIRKGMVYSPAHGDTAFTVPMFDAFLLRTLPIQDES